MFVPLAISLTLATHPPPDEPVVHDIPVKHLYPTMLPFAAWSAHPAAHVNKEPRGSALTIGLIRRGDWVVVRGCEPSCDDPKGWALLEPFGYVRLADLHTSPQIPEDALAQATFQRFAYGTVMAKRANVYERPDTSARVIRTHRKKMVLAFRDEDFAPGWMQKPSGGWMRLEDLRLAKPSELRGFYEPQTAIAIFVRAVSGIERYAMRPIFGLERSSVRVPEGLVPRDAVRLVFHRHRPREIPPNQKWVHVDISEQVLTAYEGDKWVFATLVSTGRGRHKTEPGVYRVQQKIAHTAMDSERENYFVDEVPFIQYFNQSQAFHGAFWHDRFGNVMSHGCVNLSIDDAAWLFEWSNPRLPEGWQTIVPYNANLASLWVHVQKRAPLGTFAPAAQSASQPTASSASEQEPESTPALR